MAGKQEVDIKSLSIDQLQMLRKSLSQEINALHNNYTGLKMAERRYNDTQSCLTKIGDSEDGTEMMVPLTQSLYVPGKLKSRDKVLVDIGTGYYVNKTPKEAEAFMARKISFLSDKIENVQKVIGIKTHNVEQVTAMLQAKVQAAAAAAGQ